MNTMKRSVGLNLRVTGHCNQGGRKYMEDAFVVGYQQSENLKELVYAYFGIFDGHGGREAALFAKENLMNNIVCQKEFWSDDDNRVLKAIRDGFLTTHQAMWKEVEKWPKTVSGLPSTSGTTSSIAFIRKRKLYIGHVGDSKIVLGCQLPNSNNWCAQALTRDHKPESPEEKKRINSVGGLVLAKAGVQRVVWNRPHPGHKGPIRRSTPIDQIPFLAVSRSLGDLWSFNYRTNEFVVSPDPDVDVFDLNPRIHRCVIFGSDGLWNMITAQSAVNIVQKTDEENERIILEGGRASDTEKQMNNPSKLLVDTALKNWFTLGMRADNISVVTVMLDPPGPSRREVLLKQRVMKRLRPRDEMNEDETIEPPVVKEASPSSMKDKKRTIDCIESPKEKKLSEPPCKERKLSTEDDEIIPKNLPRPVILSPIKVLKSKNCSSSSNPSASTTNMPNSSNTENCSSTCLAVKSTEANPSHSTDLDAKVKKKGHDPPNEVSTSKLNEMKNNFITPPAGPLSGCCEKLGESSKNDSKEHTNISCENSKEQTTLLLGGENDILSKNDKSDGSYQANSGSKENGRVHLCEVDNFFKLTERTTDCNESRSVKTKNLQEKDSIVPHKVKNFRKSTLTCRNNTIRKKSLCTLRKSRLQTNISPCRTRAQSNIQKLKV